MDSQRGLFIDGAWRGTGCGSEHPVRDPAAAEAPFGGTRSSGMGREAGTGGIGDSCSVKLGPVVPW